MTYSLGAPGAKDVDPTEVKAAILQALRDLPPQRMEEVMERFVDAVIAFEESTSIGPFWTFANDLTRTALLHRTPGYTDALRRAEEAERTGFPEAVPVDEFVRRLKQVG